MNDGVQNPDEARASKRLAWAVAALLIGFAIVNLVAPATLRHWDRYYYYRASSFMTLVGYVLMGVMIAEGALLAFWAVLGPQRLLKRFCVVLIAGAYLWAMFLNGSVLAGFNVGAVQDFFYKMLLWPFGVLAMQIPFWGLKWYLGCRMIRMPDLASSENVDGDALVSEHFADAPAGRQLGLSQIMMLTTLAAVSLGLAGSFVQMLVSPTYLDAMYVSDAAEAWQGIFSTLGMVFFISLIFGLPCLCGALMIPNRGIAWALTGMMFAVAAIAFLVGAEPPVCFCAGVATFFGSLQLMRFCGYELMWPARFKRWVRRVSQQDDALPWPPLTRLIAVALIGFALVDVILPWVLVSNYSNPYIAAIFMGAVVAQCAALAFWAVLGPQRLPVRFFGVLGVAALLWTVFCIGMVIAARVSPDPDEWFCALLMLPVMAIAAEGPIWIMKWISGCRMIRWPRDRVAQQGAAGAFLEEASARRQFSLAQILALTTFAAAALGMMSSSAYLAAAPPGRTWIAMSILFAMFFVLSMITVVPCIRGTLMARRPRTRVLVPLFVASALWVACVVLLYFGRRLHFELLALPFLLVFTAVGSFFAILQAVRRCGYELMWPRRAKELAGEHFDNPAAVESSVDFAETQTE